MRALRLFSQAAVALAAMVTLAKAEDHMPWQTNLEAAQQMAAQSNRLVLIHFWAPWCQPCMRLEKEVFSHADTARALEANFVMVKLNVDEAPGTAKLYGVSSLPTDVLITASGRLVSAIQSPPTASQYAAQLNQAAAGHRDLMRGGQAQIAQNPQPGTGVAAPGVNANHAIIPATASAMTQAPMSGAAVVTAGNPNATLPPATQSAYANERYAEYFRQQQNAQQQNAQQPNMAPPGMNSQQMMQPQMASATQPNPQAQSAGQPPQAAVYGNPQGYAPRAVYQPQPQIQLPPGAPPLGLDGYCPVSLVERNQWVMGDRAWGVVHRGRTYLFLGPEEQKKFWANPDLYSPVLSGNDPVLALDNQMSVPGRREFGVYLDRRVYLFADESSRQRFEQNPRRYAAEILQATR